MAELVAGVLVRVLEDAGSATVRELAAAVRGAGGSRVSRTLVERVLRDDPRFVVDTELGRSRWRLVEGDGEDHREPRGRPRPDTRSRLDALALRNWQAEALATWSETGRGVVEAVTGTGKTRLAMAAIRIVVDRGGC